MAMNVLIVGDSSLVGGRLARRLLHNGHRVTFMQHVDQELRVPANDNRVLNDLLAELTATEKQFSIRLLKTCVAASMSQHTAPGAPPISHVVFVTISLLETESPRTAFVRHSLQCLSSLLEETKLHNPRPVYTLVSKAYDAIGNNANVKFDSVMDSAMEIVLRMYGSLYNTPVIKVQLSPGIDKHISKTLSSVSPITEEVTSSIVDAMQKRSWCDDMDVVDGVDHYTGLSGQHPAPWTRLLSWNAPDLSTPATSAGEGEDVVLTTYLTSKRDPQRKVFVARDKYTYVAGWHLSMRDIGIKGVVFHDGLSSEFRCVCFHARRLVHRVRKDGINLPFRERKVPFYVMTTPLCMLCSYQYLGKFIVR